MVNNSHPGQSYTFLRSVAVTPKEQPDKCACCGGETFVVEITRCRGCEQEFYTRDQSLAASHAAHTEDAPQEEPCTPACGKQYVGEHHSEHCPHFDGGPDDAQPSDAAQPAEAACEMRRKAETAIENAAFVTSDKYEYLARAILTYLGTYAAPPKEELSDDIPTRAGDPSDCDATPLPRLSEADEHRFSEAD